MSLATYTGETVAVYNALETLTFRSTDNVNERCLIHRDVTYSDDVAELKLLSKVCREFDKLFLRGGSCLFEMPHQRRAGVLFGCFVIGKLYSGITIFLNCTNLRNNARTSLDNSARYILTVGTENGSHSDFLSN